MTLPIDRTALTAAQTNQVPNALIRSALNIAAIKAPYDAIDELNNKIDATQAPGTVTTSRLVDGSVTTVKIADNAVTASKISDGSVTTAKHADGSVTTIKLGDLSVTASKIAAGTITSDKFVPGALQNETQNGLEIVTLKKQVYTVFNVKVYGAVGNGIADDTDAIQATINAAKSNGGGIVYLPDGTYLLKKTIPAGLVPWAIRDPNLLIESANNLKFIGTGNSILKMDKVANLAEILLVYKCTNIEVSGIQFSGNIEGLQPADNNAGFAFESVVGLHVHDCQFYGLQGSFVVGDWAFNALFERCRFTVSSGSAFDVAFLQDFTVRDCDLRGNGMGLNALGTQGFQCAYDTPNETRNLTGETMVNGISNNITLDNNRISGFHTGVYFADMTDSNIINNHIFDNYTAADNYSWGILLNNTKNTISMRGIHIAGNKIHNNGTGTGVANAGGAIYLSAGTSALLAVKIRDNEIFDNTANAILLTGSVGTIEMQAIENRLYNRVGSLQTVPFSGFVNLTTDSQVIGNVGYNPRSTAVLSPGLPAGTAPANAITNTNPFPVTIFQLNGTGLHIIRPDGFDTVVSGGNQGTIRLLPFHKIYFATANTVAWTWSGE